MAATATLIPAPPLAPVNKVGRLMTTATVIETSDPHVGLGVIYERDIQVNGSAVWDGNACETGGTDKAATEIGGTVTGIPYTVFQSTKCRMINTWDTLGPRTSLLFEAGEWRTIEEAFADALIAGDYGTVSAGPTATDATARATFAAAENYIRNQMAYGVILASPEVITYAVGRDVVIRNGDVLETKLGTPVIALPGLGDDLYVTGQIVVWRGPRSEPRPVMTAPYTNEFVVLTERIFTIAVESEDSMEIVKWTVVLTAS